MTWVLFDGGQRDGQVEEYDPGELALLTYLVFDGPQWIGVYHRTPAGRTVLTAHAPAQVWTSLS